MLYPAFVARMAKRCHESGISVAIDTAGNVPYDHFEQVIEHTDLFLYDIKCLDSALHLRGTGVGNERILENLAKLQSMGCCILIRIPCIPDFNEGAEVERICDYCEKRGLPFDVLSYHRLGEDKAKALCHG